MQKLQLARLKELEKYESILEDIGFVLNSSSDEHRDWEKEIKDKVFMVVWIDLDEEYSITLSYLQKDLNSQWIDIQSNPIPSEVKKAYERSKLIFK